RRTAAARERDHSVLRGDVTRSPFLSAARLPGRFNAGAVSAGFSGFFGSLPGRSPKGLGPPVSIQLFHPVGTAPAPETEPPEAARRRTLRICSYLTFPSTRPSQPDTRGADSSSSTLSTPGCHTQNLIAHSQAEPFTAIFIWN